MSEDIGKRIKQFIQVRDVLKEMEETYQKKRKPLLEVQEMLSGILRTFLEDNNLENLKTEAGTCYISTRYTATLSDPEAFMNYVTKTGRFELIERRAAATPVQAYVKENGVLPPGCNLNAVQTVGVRRAGDK